MSKSLAWISVINEHHWCQTQSAKIFAGSKFTLWLWLVDTLKFAFYTETLRSIKLGHPCGQGLNNLPASSGERCKASLPELYDMQAKICGIWRSHISHCLV